jgi:histone H3/H4
MALSLGNEVKVLFLRLPLLMIENWLHEITFYKQQAGTILGRLPFMRLVREIYEHMGKIVKWRSSVMAALQHLSESILVIYFELLYSLLLFLLISSVIVL